MSSFNQFKLLLWKNYLLQKRRPIATIIELAIPIVLALIIILIRTTTDVYTIKEITTWDDFTVDSLPPFDKTLVPDDNTFIVAYTPNHINVIDEIMANVKMLLNSNIPKSKLETECGINPATLSNVSSGNLSSIEQACIDRVLGPFFNSFSGNNRSHPIFPEKVVPKIELKRFPSEEVLLEYVKNDTNLKKTLAGVVFRRISDQITLPRQLVDTIPNHLNIILRFHGDPITGSSDTSLISGIRNTWQTSKLFPRIPPTGPRANESKTGGLPYYYNEGFLSLLHAVNRAIGFHLSNSSNDSYSTSLKRYPYPPYLGDPFIAAIQRTLPLIIMLCFLYTSLIIVRSIVQEKELKLKEYMIMMGLSNWLHWFAWFVKYLLFLGISCLFMTALFKVKVGQVSILTYSNPFVIFLFFIIYAIATINFNFLVSVFFSKANVGTAAGGILFMLSYTPYMFMSDNYDSLSVGVKIVSSLLSNVAMSFGWVMIGTYEGREVGAQWNTIAKGVTVDENFTLLYVFLMLLFDAVLYMLLALYIEGVWPGEYGVPKPWYFPFTKEHWFGVEAQTSEYRLLKNRDVEATVPHVAARLADTDQEFFEPDPKNLMRTVEIKKLKKIFTVNGKPKVAVEDLSLNMYDGQITVLLGHNGAGKTTTMSMLTGFFPPTDGDALVEGHSIRKDIKGVRKAMGLCPQFNILFDLLTVDEHVYFFARLKGLNAEEAKAEVKVLKRSLKLTDKGSAQSRTLSGGMKRKLSVGIALCAGSKYVILDEPTSGMDPAARRAIWELLQLYRSKCSILLSTHFMDEADFLGDRIAIMAAGKLRCSGSPVFLKSKFGVGYHIVMTRSPECNVKNLTELIQSHVSETQLERTAGAELSYVLPFHASPKFAKLFQELDDNATNLGIFGYGAVVTTLEEVFLRVTENNELNVRDINQKMSRSQASVVNSLSANKVNSFSVNAHYPDVVTTNSIDNLHVSKTLNVGATLWFQQFYALLIKKIIHSRRNYKVAVSQILVPALFALLAILSIKYNPIELANIPLDLSIDAYGPTTIYLENPEGLEIGDSYKNEFQGTEGIVQNYIGNNLGTFLADERHKMGGTFDTSNIISASFNKTGNSTHAIGWFNNQAYHSPATSLAYLDHSYLRNISGRNLEFTYVNSPFPRNSSRRIQEQLIGSFSGFFLGFNIVLGFSFLSASFCLFLVRERIDRAGLLQTLSGVEPFCFWLSAFAWDFVNFLIPCFLTIVLLFAFELTEFINHIGIVITLFVLFCWSSLPLMYLLSLLFDVPSTALVRVTMINVITGSASVIVVNVLRFLQEYDVADTLNWIFLLMPQYCLGLGLTDLYTNDKVVNACTVNVLTEDICKELDIDFQTNFLAWEQYGVGKFVVFMASEGFLFFAILFFFSFNLHHQPLRIFSKIRSSFVVAEESCSIDGDDDVVAESKLVEDTAILDLTAQYALVMKNLKKAYVQKTKSFLAVKNLNIAVPKNECFGLLGINGAGKTTTFKMLTGDHAPTSGTAYINGFNIKTELRQAQQRIGYCPQFDALIEQMTGSETLWMFARLRGVPEHEIGVCVRNLGSILNFSEHLDKQCGKYSGGNKRKLSTAIALVGGPPVILLDEPSTGMDPGARRKLWDALTSIRKLGKSMVITSHSMEECEALCTRIAIMVNGAIKCIGGPQHLKSKYSQGYTVEINCTDTAVVDNLMKDYFPGCELKDTHNYVLIFSIPCLLSDGMALSLSTVFDRMETVKQKASFSDYTVTQTTLEQVFLQLVRWQNEALHDMN